jgi:hypothetical protein
MAPTNLCDDAIAGCHPLFHLFFEPSYLKENIFTHQPKNQGQTVTAKAPI